jgi:hypothetical protein
MGLGDEIARTIRRHVRAARAAIEAATDAGQPGHVNVRHPRNVVISANVGGRGSTQATSTRQTVRMRQDGIVSEESETIERHSTRR